MGHCKDCKWWVRKEKDTLELSVCPDEWWHYCRQPLLEPAEIYLMPQDMPLNGLRFDTYHSWLQTGPDFGCVNFEKKESKT